MGRESWHAIKKLFSLLFLILSKPRPSNHGRRTGRNAHSVLLQLPQDFDESAAFHLGHMTFAQVKHHCTSKDKV